MDNSIFQSLHIRLLLGQLCFQLLVASVVAFIFGRSGGAITFDPVTVFFVFLLYVGLPVSVVYGLVTTVVVKAVDYLTKPSSAEINSSSVRRATLISHITATVSVVALYVGYVVLKG